MQKCRIGYRTFKVQIDFTNCNLQQTPNSRNKSQKIIAFLPTPKNSIVNGSLHTIMDPIVVKTGYT